MRLAPGFPCALFHFEGQCSCITRAHTASREGELASCRHCEEPTGRANARPKTGSATKQSILPFKNGLLRLARNDDVLELSWLFEIRIRSLGVARANPCGTRSTRPAGHQLLEGGAVDSSCLSAGMLTTDSASVGWIDGATAIAREVTSSSARRCAPRPTTIIIAQTT